MAANCRFAFAVHILAMLAYRQEDGATSEVLAASVNTNPVVIRRLLTILRHAGFISTRHGARAGSRLNRRADEISLDEVYRAVEASPSFSLRAKKPNRRCPVGRQMEAVLGGIFEAAQAALEQALSRRTLADVLATVRPEAPVVLGSRQVRKTA
jgi:Rrf2 family protein